MYLLALLGSFLVQYLVNFQLGAFHIWPSFCTLLCREKLSLWFKAGRSAPWKIAPSSVMVNTLGLTSSFGLHSKRDNLKGCLVAQGFKEPQVCKTSWCWFVFPLRESFRVANQRFFSMTKENLERKGQWNVKYWIDMYHRLFACEKPFGPGGHGLLARVQPSPIK